MDKKNLVGTLKFFGPDFETLTSNTRKLVGLSFNPKATGAWG